MSLNRDRMNVVCKDLLDELASLARRGVYVGDGAAKLTALSSNSLRQPATPQRPGAAPAAVDRHAKRALNLGKNLEAFARGIVVPRPTPVVFPKRKV